MANTFFKSFAEADRTSSRTLLHEAIPITGMATRLPVMMMVLVEE